MSIGVWVATSILCLLALVYSIVLHKNKMVSYLYFENNPVNNDEKGRQTIYKCINRIPVLKYGIPNVVLDDKQHIKADGVYILPSGLYVFDSINTYGEIDGDIANPDEKWSHFNTLASGYFNSPVSNNERFISSLGDIVSIDDINVYNVVAYGPKCLLKIRNKKTRGDVVICKYKSIYFEILSREIRCIIRKEGISNDRIKEIGKQLYELPNIGGDES